MAEQSNTVYMMIRFTGVCSGESVQLIRYQPSVHILVIERADVAAVRAGPEPP